MDRNGIFVIQSFVWTNEEDFVPCGLSLPDHARNSSCSIEGKIDVSRVLFSSLEPSGSSWQRVNFFNSSIQSEGIGWPGNNAEMPCPAQCYACSPDLRGQGSRANFPDRTSPLPQEAQTSCIMLAFAPLPLSSSPNWSLVDFSSPRWTVGLGTAGGGKANR